MSNEKNLKPFQATDKGASERGRAGGLASGRARKKRKALRELLDVALKMPSEKRDMSKAESIAVALVERAEDGDVRAFEAIRDTVGEKPVDKADITTRDNHFSAEDAEKRALNFMRMLDKLRQARKEAEAAGA